MWNIWRKDVVKRISSIRGEKKQDIIVEGRK
jgi:hypothetical protein